MLVLLPLLLAACGTRDGEGSRALIGTWESKPFLSQLGPGVLLYEFDEDGHFRMEQQLETLPTAPLRAEGTWRLEGTRLFQDGKHAYEVSWEGPVLVLTEPSGDAYRLLRKGPDR